MPRGPAWSMADINKIVTSLRDGVRLVEVLSWFPNRSRTAITDELQYLGYGVRALCREGRMKRIAKVVADGGRVKEIMASEGVKEAAAQKLLKKVIGPTDRRTVESRTDPATMRRVYLQVREHGYGDWLSQFNLSERAAYRMAERYRSLVLPGSQPIPKPTIPRNRRCRDDGSTTATPTRRG